MKTYKSNAQLTCYKVDIVFLILILLITFVTLGEGIFLFLFYIPCSLIVHFVIYLDEKQGRKDIKKKNDTNSLNDQPKNDDQLNDKLS